MEFPRRRAYPLPMKPALVVLLLALFAGLALHSMVQKSATYDEPIYLSSGWSYLRAGRLELNREHPPLLKLLIGLGTLVAAPDDARQLPGWDDAVRDAQGFGAEFLFDSGCDADTLLFWGRLPVLLLALVLGLGLAAWARALYGDAAGLVALFGFALSPNLLAHARLATLDLGAAACLCGASWSVWALCRKPGWGRCLLCALLVLAALLSKAVNLVLLGALPLAVLLAAPKRRLGLRWLAAAFSLAALLLAAGALVGYGLGDFLASVELGVFGRARLTKAGYASFYWGESSTEGFPSYYFGAFLLKTPLPCVLLVLVGLGRLFWRRKGAEALLLLPALTLFAAGALVSHNIGLRQVLGAYPLLLIFAAGVAVEAWKRRRLRWLLVLLGLWYAGGTLARHPHYLPWFNELAGGPRGGIAYLDDSNIDWGQDLKGLAVWVREQEVDTLQVAFFGQARFAKARAYYDLPAGTFDFADIAAPPPGIVAVSAHLLQRPRLLADSPVRFDWLERFTPRAVIGHSIYVYEFPERTE